MIKLSPTKGGIELTRALGCIAIIAFHAGIPGSAWMWVWVEAFFLVAAYLMVSAMARDEPLMHYAYRRWSRISLMIFPVWFITMFLWVKNGMSAALVKFTLGGPLLIYNLLAPARDLELLGFLAAPLWFVCALWRLQVLFYSIRKYVLMAPIWVICVLSLLIGCVFRVGTYYFIGRWRGEFTENDAQVLYMLPFSHLEAFACGIILARGASISGKIMVGIGFLVVGAGAIGVMCGGASLGSLGYPSGLLILGGFVWGYPMLGCAVSVLVCALSLVALNGVGQRLLTWFASYSAEIYAFHAVFITGLLVFSPSSSGLNKFLFGVLGGVACAIMWRWALGWVLQQLRIWRKY